MIQFGWSAAGLLGRYDLSDEEWRIVAPLLPVRGRGKHRVDDRIALVRVVADCGGEAHIPTQSRVRLRRGAPAGIRPRSIESAP